MLCAAIGSWASRAELFFKVAYLPQLTRAVCTINRVDTSMYLVRNKTRCSANARDVDRWALAIFHEHVRQKKRLARRRWNMHINTGLPGQKWVPIHQQQQNS